MRNVCSPGRKALLFLLTLMLVLMLVPQFVMADEEDDDGFGEIAFPGLDLEKSGEFVDNNDNDYADLGDEINYRFEIAIIGEIQVEDITVVDYLLSHDPLVRDSGDDNDNDILEDDETWVYMGTYALTEDDLQRHHVHNVAAAYGLPTMDDDDDELTERSILSSGPILLDVDRERVDLPQPPRPDPFELDKVGVFVDENDNTYADAGDMIHYTITLTHPEDLHSHRPWNIELTDSLLGTSPILDATGDTNDNGKFDAGEVWIYTGMYTLLPADIVAGSVYNKATAYGTHNHDSDDDNEGPSFALTSLSDDWSDDCNGSDTFTAEAEWTQVLILAPPPPDDDDDDDDDDDGGGGGTTSTVVVQGATVPVPAPQPAPQPEIVVMGAEMPDTGDTQTTIQLILFAILVLAGAVLMILFRKSQIKKQ